MWALPANRCSCRAARGCSIASGAKRAAGHSDSLLSGLLIVTAATYRRSGDIDLELPSQTITRVDFGPVRFFRSFARRETFARLCVHFGQTTGVVIHGHSSTMAPAIADVARGFTRIPSAQSFDANCPGNWGHRCTGLGGNTVAAKRTRTRFHGQHLTRSRRVVWRPRPANASLLKLQRQQVPRKRSLIFIQADVTRSSMAAEI
jgi:hypothetical protein